jgi:hypothetical protein
VGGREAAVCRRKVGLVAVEGAVLIAARDVGLLDAAGGAALDAAVAGLGELAAVLLDNAQAGAFTEGAGAGGGIWSEAGHRLQYRRRWSGRAG